AAFRDAEYRARRALAADMQGGVAVACDDERVGRVVGLDQSPQRHGDAFDVLLRLDAERPLGQRGAHDLGPVGKAQRRHRLIDAARHGLVRVRIDDANARAAIGHGGAHTARLRTWPSRRPSAAPTERKIAIVSSTAASSIWRCVTSRSELRLQAPDESPAFASAAIQVLASLPLWPTSIITMLVSTRRGSVRRGSIACRPSAMRLARR